MVIETAVAFFQLKHAARGIYRPVLISTLAFLLTVLLLSAAVNAPSDPSTLWHIMDTLIAFLLAACAGVWFVARAAVGRFRKEANDPESGFVPQKQCTTMHAEAVATLARIDAETKKLEDDVKKSCVTHDQCVAEHRADRLVAEQTGKRVDELWLYSHTSSHDLVNKLSIAVTSVEVLRTEMAGLRQLIEVTLSMRADGATAESPKRR